MGGEGRQGRVRKRGVRIFRVSSHRRCGRKAYPEADFEVVDAVGEIRKGERVTLYRHFPYLLQGLISEEVWTQGIP